MPGRDEAAARLIERVLSDAAFRARFRRDPEAAAREAGLDPVEGRAFETLELRESKSSLAGAMLAAAVEGIAVYDYVDHLAGGGNVAQASAAVDPDDHLGLVDDGDEPDDAGGSDDPGDGGDESDSADESDGSGESDDTGTSDDSGDADETDDSGDEDDDDSEDEDEDEDEDEPDEEEPDEVGPDQDDLTDDEVVDDPDDEDDESDDGSESSDDGSDGDDGSDSSDDGADESDGDESSAGEGAVPDLGDVDSAYPGDDAPREQLAQWMAAEAQRRGLPPELPVMAALVESGLQNLPGGDADSIGFFQMRASIWNSGAYAGYAGKPELQLDWFLDHAKEVGGKRDDPASYGEWIANVERPAEQYRGRYQERLDEARELLRNHRPPEELIDGAGGEPQAGPRARAALTEARKYLGTPYLWGGSSPKTGFDCSGLVQWAYAEAGIRIPRVTDQQILAENATKVARKDLLPGDLVFFRDDTGYVHHVGISLGGNRFIHAPHTGDVVKVSSLKEPYYAEQFTGGRRFDPAVAEPDDSAADERAVTDARVALRADADEVSRPGTALHLAVAAQEQHNENSYTQVLPVIRPDQVRRA